jgi:hypothetical protein
MKRLIVVLLAVKPKSALIRAALCVGLLTAMSPESRPPSIHRP